MPDEQVILCHRCGRELHPGEGNFYVVAILAVADAAPPVITDEDLRRDLDQEMRRLIALAAGRGVGELMDQVYRRMTLHLCAPCYEGWIEDPAGRISGQ